MIHDVLLRWAVTVLFGLGTVGCFVAIFTPPRSWISGVGNVLHVVMAVAMVVMAWPWGLVFSTWPPMVFFLLATVWFAAVMVSPAAAGHRVGNLYHALMMLAMAWMYAVMTGDLLPGQVFGVRADVAVSSGHGAHMPGMEMPVVDGTGLPEPVTGHPLWISAINWLCIVGFAVAALYWLYRLVGRRNESGEVAHGRLGILCQVMIAAGMAIMFGAML